MSRTGKFGTILSYNILITKNIIMTWTKTDYPIAMENLDNSVREKAIEIANNLVEKEHINEGMSIPIAISKAKEWIGNNK